MCCYLFHTVALANLTIPKVFLKVCDLFAIKHFCPWQIIIFNAKEVREHWLAGVAKGNGTLKSRERCNFSAAAQYYG